MADAESISLEETNRIRIELGLAPLKPVSEETQTIDEAGNIIITADEEERKAVENLKALRTEQAKAAEEAALRQRLKRIKDRKSLNEKLTGTTLADVIEGENDDLKAWIKKNKRRERELASKKAEELENQDKHFQEEYTSANLKGLRVAHDVGDIESGDGIILTLKDQGVLEEDEGDELISTSIAEKERLRQNLENKIRKPKYNPYAEEYDAETGEKKLLSKYDDEIKKTFIIGETEDVKDSSMQDGHEHLVKVSLDYDKPVVIASDYADPSTFKIKKPKKKKAKNLAKVSEILQDDGLLEIDTGNSMLTEPIQLPTTKRTYNEDSALGDDDELQELLAQRRRQALKKRKFSRPEDIATQVRKFEDEQMIPLSHEGGIVIDDMSEFVRGIEMAQVLATEEARQEEEAPDDMNIELTENIKDADMTDAVVETTEEPTEGSKGPSTGLDEEVIIGDSVAATLAALIRQDAFKISESNFSMEDLHKREETLQQQRERKVQQEREARLQRERERQSERFKRMTQRERELYREEENKKRERQEAYQRMQEFNDFKFNVDIEYKDEFGQEMTPKDAFKRLSHTFHGKSSGTMKKGKYLQKVMEKMEGKKGSTVGDLNRVDQQREKQKSTGKAYMRIQ